MQMLKAFAMMISSAFCTCNKNNNNNTHTHTQKTCIKSITHLLCPTPLYPPPPLPILLYVYNKRNKAEMLSSVMINERKL